MGEEFDNELHDSSRHVVDEGRELSAWEELGGGDPRKRRIELLMTEINEAVFDIDQNYRPLERADRSIFKLNQALNIIGTAAPYHNLERYVDDVLAGRKKIGSRTTRNEAIRAYDSLGLLLNAYDFVLPETTTGLPDEAKFEQFTQVNAPSRLWERPENARFKDQLLQAVEKSYQLIGTVASPEHDSIRRYVIKLRMEFIKQGLGWNIPSRGTPGYANYENNLKKARLEAWNEFGAEAGSLLVPEDHF